MRLVSILVFTLIFCVSAYSDDTVKINKQLLKEIRNKLATLDSIEKTAPQVDLKGPVVIVDRDNRVYVSDTCAVDVWFDDLHFVGEAKTNAKVKLYARGTPFISRFGLLTAAEQKEYGDFKQFDKNSIYLDYCVLKYKRIGFEVIANFRRWGLGFSHTLTPNTKLVFGTNWRYKETMQGNTKGFVGVGFNF